MYSFLSKMVAMVKEAVTSDEYMVITGLGVDDDPKIQKKTRFFPGLYHSHKFIDLSPVNYNLEVHALSIEMMLPFHIPTDFTIGPRTEDMDALKKYAMLLASLDKNSLQVREFIRCIIESVMRVLASSTTMEEVLTQEFMQQVSNNIQLYLNSFGLKIYNDELGNVQGRKQGEEVAALNEDVQPYDEIEIDYYDL